MVKDYYKILGLDRNATEEDVKKAFRKLAVQYHPDKQQGKSDAEKKAAEEKMKEVNEAYQVLSDKEKRQQYDKHGTIDPNGFGPGMNMDDINDFIRNNFFHQGGFGFGRSGVEGEDIQVNVRMKISDVLKGVKKTIKYDRYTKCPHCNGTGSENGELITCPHCHGTGEFVNEIRVGPTTFMKTAKTCPHCHGMGKYPKKVCKHCGGEGVVSKLDEFSFEAPLGVTNGAYFTVDGRGHETKYGNPGRLKVVFIIEPEDGFFIDSRQGNMNYDLTVFKEIPIIDCITGGETTIKHLDGNTYKFTIKPGMKEGNIVRLREKGLRDQNGKRGFLNIVIKQKMPSKFTKTETELLNKLRRSKNFA